MLFVKILEEVFSDVDEVLNKIVGKRHVQSAIKVIKEKLMIVWGRDSANYFNKLNNVKTPL